MQYADLVIDSKARQTDCFFTYRASDQVKIGSVVYVPFGRGKKERRAFVFALSDQTKVDPAKIRDIIRIDENLSLSGEMIETAAWMRRRYFIRYADAVRCFLPRSGPARRGKTALPKKPLVEGSSQKMPSELTLEQRQVLEEIGTAIRSEKRQYFLLHGVTGSGKTEVYLRATAETLRKGKTAILLVPEIALTKQLTDRFAERFGEDRLAVLHSRLTMRERFATWERIRKGEAEIVIGARMAVFAPLQNLGLIVMDEEHEATYKADMTPKYETVDVAVKRLIHYEGVLLLGSATPSVVSYHRCEEGIYRLLELKHRYNGGPLPPIEIVDMREELMRGNAGPFGGRMVQEIRQTLAEGKQAILFLNRRGYATSIVCRSCGYTARCPECGIALTYHRGEEKAVCHYCGRRFRPPDRCPVCGSPHVRYRGAGTEKIEEQAKALFPQAQLARLDLDAARSSREINKILTSFEKGKVDILVGTQLVAKGLDFHNVGFVGILSADTSLTIPDYRASERTFQLITQVAGRAGRGTFAGKVIVQTMEPDDPAIRAAAAYDYKAMYDREIALRRLMTYPPFADLIRVEFASARKEESKRLAEDFAGFVGAAKKGDQQGRVYSPRLLRGKAGSRATVRTSVLIKSPKGQRNQYMRLIAIFWEKMQAAGRTDRCSFVADVNPYETI